jgi:hypothetical protein
MIPSRTTPTVARKLWLWNAVGVNSDPAQPFEATVCFVWEAGQHVNLRYSDHAGNAHQATVVSLYEPNPEGGPWPDLGQHATWMPYRS